MNSYAKTPDRSGESILHAHSSPDTPARMPRLFSFSTQRWQFRRTSPRGPWHPARIPGCVHTDLLRNGLIPDPFYSTNELDLQWIEEQSWEYRTTFTVPARLAAEDNVELVAEGLDTVATVKLNGTLVASTENMFAAFRWPVRSLLRPGANELVVQFDSAMKYIRTHRTGHVPPREFTDPIGGSTRIRKQACQFGWDWGPRFVTAGIWRDIRLEGWSQARLTGLRVVQTHSTARSVILDVFPEVATQGNTAAFLFRASVSLDGHWVADGSSNTGRVRISLPHPQLWWPAGQGAQPLYVVTLDLIGATSARILDRAVRRIGLRTIVLDRHPDKWGESFQYVVNGRPIFAKGANWIPAHSFVADLKRKNYARDLDAAVAANMNMIRLWGGGIYESEHFYDLCDELGLLVWHDFMFACSTYPADDAFVELVRQELLTQIPRIRHHACLALWCGNNEICQINRDVLEEPAIRAEYERIFHQLIPEMLALLDPRTPYWPSSEWRGAFNTLLPDGEKRGDTHFWEVWHSRKPVKEYENYALRFCSEFGMQSYGSPEAQRSTCPPDDRNLFGRALENHQKNPLGSQIILDYVTRRYGYPKDQDSLLLLSQLNQAYCMQVAVEHYRRLTPRCMGAVYWQLNDCWPVASWSSIEFDGRWKALHHVARRFFAPALVSAHVPGDDVAGKNNYRQATTREVRLHTVFDAPQPTRATLRWELFLVASGRRILRGRKRVMLIPGTATLQMTLDLARSIAHHGRDDLVLRYALEIAGKRVSEDSAFLSQPRFVNLPRTSTKVKIRMRSRTEAEIVFASPVFQHRFNFNIGLSHRCEDNFFELFPGEPKTVQVVFAEPVTRARILKALSWGSLADYLA